MNFAEPLKIDSFLTLADRALPAPMAGVTNPVFCLAASRMGLVRNWITPFQCVSRGSVPSRTALLKKIQPFLNGNDLIVQLLGHDAEALAMTAARLGEMPEVSGVNLNFACPAPLVGKNGNGGILLKEPDKIFELADAVVRAAADRTNISVKIRCGYEDSNRETADIVSALSSAGIRFFIAHFRTVTEMYTPVPQEVALSRLAKLRELLPVDAILIGNGDIRSYTDALRMCEISGCDGIAAARALPGNPFLLRHIRAGLDSAPDDGEKMEFLRQAALAAQDLGYSMTRWAKTGFLELAGMCRGRESGDFREIVSDPVMFLRKKLQIKLAE